MFEPRWRDGLCCGRRLRLMNAGPFRLNGRAYLATIPGIIEAMVRSASLA